LQGGIVCSQIVLPGRLWQTGYCVRARIGVTCFHWRCQKRFSWGALGPRQGPETQRLAVNVGGQRICVRWRHMLTVGSENNEQTSLPHAKSTERRER
jgi:hypothetical protein